MTSRLAIRLLSTLALFGLVHCGPPPLAPCPDAGTQLTYDNFGDSFIGTYCVQCHGAALAEKGVLLNTAGLVRSQAEKVNAATTGLSMPPPQAAAPSTSQREQLSEWLSCGAP